MTPDFMTWLGPTLLSAIPDDPRETPTNCVAVLGFDDDGYRVSTSPLSALGTRATDARLVTGIVRRVAARPRPHRIVIALYIGGPPEPRHYALQHEIAREAHEYDIHLVESFYVSPIGWGSLTCDDPLCELTGPHDLELLRQRRAEWTRLG
jgi:hypothetical protein